MQAPPDIHSYAGTARGGQLSSVRLPLSIALLSAGFSGMSLLPAAAQVLPGAAQVLPAAAQVLPAAQVAASTQQTAASSPDGIKQREQELEAAPAQQKSAPELQIKRQTGLTANRHAHSITNPPLSDTS